MKQLNKTNRHALLLLSSALLFSSQAWAAGDAGFVPVGPMKLVPVVNISHEYDDNIFRSEKNTKSSQVTVINPIIAVQMGRANVKTELSYGLTKSIHYSSRQDDAIDHVVNLDVNADLSSRLQTSFGASYSKLHDARGSTFSGTAVAGVATPDKYHDSALHATLGYGLRGRIDLSGGYDRKRYDTNRFRTAGRDLDTMDGGVSFSFPIMSKTKAVVEARYSKINYKALAITGNLDSNEQRYFGGFDWDATAKTSGSLRVGYLRKHFKDAANAGTGNLSWELGMEWQPLSYSTVSLNTEATTNETDGLGTFIKTKSGSISWNHGWSSRLSHTLSGSYSQNRYIGAAVARKDNLVSLGASLDYQMWRWLNIGASYDYSNRNSNVANSSYKNNVVALNIQATM